MQPHKAVLTDYSFAPIISPVIFIDSHLPIHTHLVIHVGASFRASFERSHELIAMTNGHHQIVRIVLGNVTRERLIKISQILSFL